MRFGLWLPIGYRELPLIGRRAACSEVLGKAENGLGDACGEAPIVPPLVWIPGSESPVVHCVAARALGLLMCWLT